VHIKKISNNRVGKKKHPNNTLFFSQKNISLLQLWQDFEIDFKILTRPLKNFHMVLLVLAMNIHIMNKDLKEYVCLILKNLHHSP